MKIIRYVNINYDSKYQYFTDILFRIHEHTYWINRAFVYHSDYDYGELDKTGKYFYL